MRISDIFTAKALKFKLSFSDLSVNFNVGSLLRIVESERDNEFFVNQYGTDITEQKSILCKASPETSQYITDLFETEKVDSFRCIFSIEGVNNGSIEVQTYNFRSVTEYKTTIYIQVSEKLLQKTNIEKLYKEYVWNQLGEPALFCLNYKDRKKQNADLRFICGKRFFLAHNTPRGIVAVSESYIKGGYDVPVDLYIAPEIKFVTEDDNVYVNDSMAADLDKVSNPASYFARWEAYNELSKKLLEQENKEFGSLKYASCVSQTDLNSTSFEFVINEELDDSFKGKEVAVSEFDNSDKTVEREKIRQIPVGVIKRIVGNTVTTYLENVEGFDAIPNSGYLSLYTAGDKFIMARRDAARTRMINHKSPIKYIVSLIEAGASEYELSSDWSSHPAITSELRRNFSRADSLNLEQIEAIKIAINSPDVAIIQGPPGTGKTTVIKAICERYREIFEANERALQKHDPDHQLRSPKILISSFQNEAVTNAISAPLPGDIPAYRKTAKRTKDSIKEQYQKSLDAWYTSVCDSIKDQMESDIALEFVKNRKLLSDEFLSYKNSGESLELATKLIKHYLSFVEIEYPNSLIDQANAVIKSSESPKSVDENDPIVAKIESQRLDRKSFEDDGLRNAKLLAAHIRIRPDLSFDENTTQIIDKICSDNFSDADFEKYIAVIKELQSKYCVSKVSNNVRDKAVINRCLLALYDCFTKQYISTLSDVESKKLLILSEFVSKLEQEYETLVEKYSMTMAATCQTCLDLHDDSPRVFDLVVIDEAARANPLDLFIPMSMGKKIVLVGDHKQLPHMLEPDVLKLITEDAKFKDLPGIEMSLFERLFEMFSKGQNQKSIQLTQQFRMHPDICDFVSNAFYDGKLKTSEKITPDMRSSPNELNYGKALTFVNVPISRGAETPGASKRRYAEVDAISEEVKHILKIDKGTSVGVITFYANQAKEIKQKLDLILDADEMSHVETGTVDAFQGREFDYVLLSCVRSNVAKDGEPHKVGFLSKPNRLCVAFSRAVRQLIVFGDMDTLIQIPCFSKLYGACAVEGRGCYREY